LDNLEEKVNEEMELKKQEAREKGRLTANKLVKTDSS
jgi:hypothetical protein